MISNCPNFVNILLLQFDPVPFRAALLVILKVHTVKYEKNHEIYTAHTEREFFNLIHEKKKKSRWEIHDDENTNVSHTAMYSNIEMLPSPLRSAFSKISERAENLY